MSRFKLLSVLLLALLSCVLLHTETARAAGESNNRLPSLSASKGVVGAQTGNGVYSSPESSSYLYIRRTAGSSSLTIRDISNQYLRGRILSLFVGYLNTSGSCVSLGSTITGSPVNAGFNNNRTYPIGAVNSYSNIRIVNDGSGNEYGVFCVTVATSSLLSDGNSNDRYQVYADVTFILETNTNNFLGVYPGVGGDDQPDVAGMYSKGTGYYGAYNQPGSTAPNGEWSQTLAFAPDCTIPDGHMEPITLYDMDTYQASNRNATIRVTRKIGMSGTETNLVLTGDIINLGNGSYQLTNKPSGATHYATPQGGFSSDYTYTLYVTRIGQSNKIRIRLPYDQINASFTCTPPNTAPSGNYSATCNAAGTGDITITANLSDADGDNVTVVTTVSGGITGMDSNPGDYAGAVGSGISIGTVTRPPNGGTYTVSGTITDGVIASPAAMTSTTVTCPRPPQKLTCSFTVSEGPHEIGEEFSITVTVNNNSLPYALPITNSTHPISVSASPSGLDGIGPASVYSYTTNSDPGSPATTATMIDGGLVSSTPNRYTFEVSAGSVVCNGSSVDIGNYSYFREYGGDVWTGGNFVNVSSSCTPPTVSGGNAFGFAEPTGPIDSSGGTPYRGTGAQLTLTALLDINGVVSASTREIPGSVSVTDSSGTTSSIAGRTYTPKGLTFANFGNLPGNTSPDSVFGGGFGATRAKCITDYYNDTKDTTLMNTGDFPPPDVPGPVVPSQTGVVWADDINTPNRISVTAGRSYRVTVWGTWQNVFGSAGQYEVDAICQQNSGVWQVQNTDPANLRNHDLQLDVNGDGIMDFVDWVPTGPTIPGSPGCSGSHTYTYDTGIIGATGLWAMRVFDGFSATNTVEPGWYGDNNSGINFSVVCLNCSSPVPGSLPSGRSQYQVDNDLTLDGINVPVGSQAAVYVAGDVYISGNVIYATGASSVEQMPNFALIVCGNIYVGSGVTRLDGLYVAQPGNQSSDCDGSGTITGGSIYTCASGMGQPMRVHLTDNSLDLYHQCQNQLVVNGSLVANRIKFLRVYGSLRDGSHGEVPDDFADGSGTSAAEVVNYTPQMWIAPSALRIPGTPMGAEGASGSTGPYDSIRTLSPIF